MKHRADDEFEYRPLENSPRAMLILWIVLSLVLVAGFSVGEAFLRDEPLEPWWGTLVAGLASYVVAAVARAPFRWRAPREEWWVPFAAILGTLLLKSVLRSLFDAGTPGAYGIALFFGILFGYLTGIGIARLRLLPDGPLPPALPSVRPLRTPTRQGRGPESEPPDPPYRGY